jgi:EmrB/QacA subfamily drug resistance transporter
MTVPSSIGRSLPSYDKHRVACPGHRCAFRVDALIMINPKFMPCQEAAILSAREPARPGVRRAWILAITSLGSAMAFVDGSVVNVALPAIEKDLAASVASIQWVINAYELSLAALLLLGGAAGDQFGRRRIFIIGATIFAAASVWCGFAPNAAHLILARGIQGVGAALLIPCSLAIIGASFEKSERGKAIGTWAASSAIAAAIGPLMGGWIVDHASWRAIFAINPVLALFVIAMAIGHLAESRDAESAHGLDWRGALLVLAGLGGVVFGLIELSTRSWIEPIVFAPIVFGVVALFAFVREERRARAPMLPLELFRSREFRGINLMTLLLYAALGGAFFFLPFDLIQVHGYSATFAGAAFLPFTIIMGTLGRWSGALQDRIGARLPLMVGPLLAALGFAFIANASTAGTYWNAFLVPIVILGLGMAIAVTPLTTTVLNAVPSHQTGVASGVNNAVASVASLFAIAIFGAIALNDFDRSLNHTLTTVSLSAQARSIVEDARGKFVTTATSAPADVEQAIAATIIKTALAHSIGIAMWLATLLSVLAAMAAARTIAPHRRAPNRSNPQIT